MVKRLVYTCDNCGKEVDEDRADSTDTMELWLHLNCSFIKKMTEGIEPPAMASKLMGDFCSAKCLKLFIESTNKNDATSVKKRKALFSKE